VGGATVIVKVVHVRLCHSQMLFVRAYCWPIGKTHRFVVVGRALGLHYQTVQRGVERALAGAHWPRSMIAPRPARAPTIT
jgi:hypothetical protein